MNSKTHIVNGAYCVDTDCPFCYTIQEEDMVNHPNHYMLDLDSGVSVEVLEIIKASLSKEEFRGYLIGNNIKYLLRHSRKNGTEDLKKMCFYSKELDSVC